MRSMLPMAKTAAFAAMLMLLVLPINSQAPQAVWHQPWREITALSATGTTGTGARHQAQTEVETAPSQLAIEQSPAGRKPSPDQKFVPFHGGSLDIDGDHKDELVFGIMSSTPVWPTYSYEAIQVTYSRTGTVDRLFVPESQQISHGYPFAESITAGDFNFDGYQDLAIGQPMDNSDMGSVWIVFGSADGLSRTGIQHIRRVDLGWMEPVVSWYPAFGSSVAAGDMNGDGFADLAIGAPAETVYQLAGAGTLTVIPGGPHGLNTDLAAIYALTSPKAEQRFGSAVSIGDLGGDGNGDLLVRDVDWNLWAGEVPALATARKGGPPVQPMFFVYRIDLKAIPGVQPTPPTQWETFGSGPVRVADVNGDGYGDAVVGLPGAQVGANIRAGAVSVLWGSANGVAASRSQTVNALTPGVDGEPIANAGLGFSLGAGDVTGDGIADIITGAPNRWGYVSIPGTALLLRGSSGGLQGQALFDAATPGLETYAVPFADFGGGASILDFDGDGDLDVAIGARFWDAVPDDGVSIPRGAVILLRNDSGVFTVDQVIKVTDLGAGFRESGYGLLTR